MRTVFKVVVILLEVYIVYMSYHIVYEIADWVVF